MKPRVEQILEDLEQATGLEHLQIAVEALRDHYRVDHVVYHWVSSSGEQYGCGTYSPEWAQRYQEQEYLRTDPVILGCFQRFHPVDWKMLDWTSRAARTFQTDALKYGVGNQGFSVPIRGPNGQFALFTVNHNCDDATWERFTEMHRRSIILVAHFCNQKALEFEPGRKPEPAQPLSPREVDAITLIAMGHSRAQVADALSISEHTLRVYIESARFKLGAANTTHAVARAISRGLIVV
ncbi:helix-turn-helix transcriptional regulator [Thalassovita taeanensis]|uniref:Regulatory protein, luxR family n=1 Tax=Thalassovita taeanensis TaxID=657014 RepID=A0A1H9D9G0_9RHOB|nr:autoinducer binding domain-containing protein [Thalassovita taeanensis]SEQ09991.1 regulatory protein, luxR family [Thalassovita taeanensis]